MFDSGLNKHDLMFSDSAVKLLKIHKEEQNYRKWLGDYFNHLMETLHRYQCDTITGSPAPSINHPFVKYFVALIAILTSTAFLL
jgi:hypothetical protein